MAMAVIAKAMLSKVRHFVDKKNWNQSIMKFSSHTFLSCLDIEY